MAELTTRNPVRRIGFFVALGLVFGVIACCGGLFWLRDRPTNGVYVDRLEADLNERLPDGSSREQAEAWFASHGIKPWGIVELDGREVGLSTKIPNDTLLESAVIWIELYFSPEGRLEKRVIYRFVYCL